MELIHCSRGMCRYHTWNTRFRYREIKIYIVTVKTFINRHLMKGVALIIQYDKAIR